MNRTVSMKLSYYMQSVMTVLHNVAIRMSGIQISKNI